MVYPNLLFYSTQEKYKIPEEVFFDIKLDALLNNNVFGVMSEFCNKENVVYRQELFKILEKPEALLYFSSLLEIINDIYELDKKYSDAICNEEKAFIFLAIIWRVINFSEKAASIEFKGSKLLDRFVEHFNSIISEEKFLSIKNEIHSLRDTVKEFDAFSFTIQGENLKVVLTKGSSYTDKLIECAKNLELRTEYRKKNYVKELSAPIINAFCKIKSESYSQIKAFFENNLSFYDDKIITYKEQIEFYVSVSQLLCKVRKRNIPTTYPIIDDNEKKIFISDAYDISLIAKNQSFIVPNDIDFFGKYSFSFLTGANGGGKTTYLRTIGINLLLALNGAPIAARSANIFPLKKMFTHFPRDERFENTGRFVDEENRIAKIINELDAESLILLNETYSTTSKEVAVAKTNELASKLVSMKVFGIYITHQHSVDSDDIPVLSVIVDETDENKRTYKISKLTQEKKSFAEDILKKYNLTKEALQNRFGVKI